MEIRFICPRWGTEQLDWDSFISKVADAGYDGIEWGIAGDVSQQTIEDVFNKVTVKGMILIPQHYDTYESDFTTHKKQFADWFRKMETLQPLFINSQTGKDFFSFEQNLEVIEVAFEFTAKTGVPVYHETHRGKFSFAAHVTGKFLEAVPLLQITLDASHWVNVAETFLMDQEEAMDIAIQKTAHIHARVGHTQGPQIADPRAPEWQFAVDAHLQWWDEVVKAKDNTLLTIAPEFGPYPYLTHLPFTQEPVASQWDINLYMKNLLKERYKK